MWNETGSIFGNQRIILANPHPGGFIVNDPTANQRIAIANARQRLKRLVNHRLIGVATVGIIDNIFPVIENRGITAFPRINRLPYTAFARRCERFFALKPGRQQIRMVREEALQ